MGFNSAFKGLIWRYGTCPQRDFAFACVICTGLLFVFVVQ